MSDQDRPGELPASNSPVEDDTVGRPNWELREQPEEEEDDDWMMAPPAPASSMVIDADDNAEPGRSDEDASETETLTEAQTQQDPTQNATVEEQETASGDEDDRMDPSRFDLQDEGAATDDARQDEPSDLSNDAEADHQGHAADDHAGQQDGREAEAQDEAEHPAPVQRGLIDPAWEAPASRTIERWSDIAERHTGREAFKTGLVLPLLNSLGYDTFDPDQVEPLEDDSGQHDGYLAKGPGGELVVLLADTEIADDHRDKVSLRARRDRVTIGIRIPNEEGEGTRWQSVIEVHLESGAVVTPLGHVHRDHFHPEDISSMARQMHGQQEHILEAMRRMILAPGAGFVEDVRRAILAEGHGDPAMLSERMALLASKLFAGDEKGEVDEDDDKTRQITPSEQQALEHIRRICEPEIAADRIVGRPAQSYLAVLLDNNNRRTIARLHFSAASRKHIGVFEGRDESRHAIGGPADVEQYSKELRDRAKELDPDAFPKVQEEADGQEEQPDQQD